MDLITILTYFLPGPHYVFQYSTSSLTHHIQFPPAAPSQSPSRAPLGSPHQISIGGNQAPQSLTYVLCIEAVD